MCQIGLSGFNVASGLGVVNCQLCNYLPITSWFETKHKHFCTLPFPEKIRTTRDPEEFLQGLDIVLFAENPLLVNLTRAKELGKRVVCVMMQEWMPADLSSWPSQVDLFICPTYHGYLQYKNLFPCVHFPWPIETDLFPFLQKDECERFLFINGHGGWQDRKGGDIVRKAKTIWPEMPLVVHSQADTNHWPATTEVHGPVKNPSDMYAAGDVLIAPHRADGIGLELLEAASSGLPLIATNGQPWNELPNLIAAIPAARGKRKIRREVDWYEPSVEGLVAICKVALGTCIDEDSRKMRVWAEQRSWSNLAGAFLETIEGKK